MATLKTKIKQQLTKNEPSWDNYEQFTPEQFAKQFRDSMAWYSEHSNSKEYKQYVLLWMKNTDNHKENIAIIKKLPDWRISSTMGGIASCLMNGMPEYYDGFNSNRNMRDWLINSIQKIVNEYETDDETEVKAKEKIKEPKGERYITETYEKVAALDDWLDEWTKSPKTWDGKRYKIADYFKKQAITTNHAKHIIGFYSNQYAELSEVLKANKEMDDEDSVQLRESYERYTTTEIKKVHGVLNEIITTANSILNTEPEPKVKKPISKDKQVSKLKYLKQSEQLSVKSINPVEIVGAKMLWVYNIRTRKIGVYVSDSGFTVKNSTIENYNKSSVQKMLRKPLEQIKLFKDANKKMVETFVDTLDSLAIPLSGKITEDTLLLKVLK